MLGTSHSATLRCFPVPFHISDSPLASASNCKSSIQALQRSPLTMWYLCLIARYHRRHELLSSMPKHMLQEITTSTLRAEPPPSTSSKCAGDYARNESMFDSHLAPQNDSSTSLGTSYRLPKRAAGTLLLYSLANARSCSSNIVLSQPVCCSETLQ